MQDGVAENGTAAMLTPYLDAGGRATDNRGHSFVEAGALVEAVAALDAAGFQVHVHAIGDRGVARGARRVRGQQRASVGTTSRTSRSCTPTTYDASPSSVSPPTPRRCGPAWTSR